MAQPDEPVIIPHEPKLVIETCKRIASDEYHACFAGSPGRWGKGNTMDEAIGDLMITHAQDLGFTFTHRTDVFR